MGPASHERNGFRDSSSVLGVERAGADAEAIQALFASQGGCPSVSSGWESR